jgi:putative SOS response-associated peptidase YedK
MRRFVQAFADAAAFSPALPPMARDLLAQAPPRYNLGKGDDAVVLFIADAHWKIATMRWGLVPSWEPEPSTRYSTQTARLERAPRSRLYRRAWATRRCAVPMNGYYKWDRTATPRQPYFIQARSGEPLFAAGLWSLWGDPEGDNLLSFSLLTHENAAIPPPLVADGPLFLPQAAIAGWLEADARSASRLLLRFAQPALEAYPVTRRVADRRRDDYTLLEPVSPDAPDDDAILDPDEHAFLDEDDGD